MYDFLWSEFADWYIEISKHPLYQGSDEEKAVTRRVLVDVLETCLRLLHPYMPFVTEEIWQYIPHEGETLMLAKWPQADLIRIDEQAENEMNVLMDMVRGIRNARLEYEVDPGRRIKAIIAPGSYRQAISNYGYIFSRLCNVSEIELLDANAAAPGDSASVVVSDATAYLPLAGMIDIQAECERLKKEQAKLQEQIERTQKQLGNEQFVSRARPDVVERERSRLADLQASAEQIARRLTALCAL
jgi:valyl-tRNA synthetase